MTMTVRVGICPPANLAPPPSIAKYRGCSFLPQLAAKFELTATGPLGALGWKAKEGKKDPSQEKERDKG